MSQSSTTVFVPARESLGAPRFSDFIELTKPRLSLMSVVSAVLGYFAAEPSTGWVVPVVVGIGCALAAFGAAALNQWWERDADALMRRTADRPAASGRVSPLTALVYGVSLSAAGVVVLYLGANAIASFLALATVLLYVLLYTPLKRVTPWALEVGALPGALPPVIGWVAAGGGLSGLGWALFAYLFVWQIPHFLAISWMCREDYRAGGFRMLAVADSSGRSVARKAFLWTLILIGATFLPLVFAQAGWLFVTVAVLLSTHILAAAFAFLRSPTSVPVARRLFGATLVHLPVYLSFLVVDRFIF